MAGIVIERQRSAEQVLRPGDEHHEGCLVEAFQDEDLAAGQQRAVELEAGVLGGGSNEDDRAVFDVREERVLLGTVESMDLVDEQERALPDLPALPSSLKDLPEVRNTGERRREGFEGQVGLLGEEPGDGRLPAPGRSPQHHRREPLSIDHPPDWGNTREEMVLPDDIGQRVRTQTVRQRPGFVVDLEQGARLPSHDCPLVRRSLARSYEPCTRSEISAAVIPTPGPTEIQCSLSR